MRMKNLRKTIILAIAASTLFSCSKKMQSFQFGSPAHQNAQTTSSTTVADNATASTNTEMEAIETASAPVVVAKAVTKSTIVENTPNADVKPSFKQKLAQKIIAKKIQKIEKKGGMDDKMKLGLVIALVSLLVLIITGAGLLGGLSGLFWLLGGLGLLTGLVIMLLVLLDVI